MKTYDIEVVSSKLIDGGFEVFAKAWKGKDQIGFGKDGSVEIERFRFFHSRFGIDDQESMLRVLDNVIKSKKEKSGPQKIVPGKVGNTTSVFFSGSADGIVFASNSDFTTARDATTGAAFSVQASSDLSANFDGSYNISRLFLPFDTSNLGDSDSISSAILSVCPETSNGDDDAASVCLIQTSQAGGGASLVDGDFDQVGSTEGATRIAFSSLTPDTYANFSLNATGLSWISKTGYTLLGLRTDRDLDNNAPTGINSYFFYLSERTGTSQDPYLTVEHTSPASFKSSFIIH